MTGKMKLYVGLLVLVLALVGAGLWFLFNPSPVIEIPEGKPVIVMNIINATDGKAALLDIYEDGTAIHRYDDKFRREAANPDALATSIWRAGKLSQEELDGLIDLFTGSDFLEMESYYQSPVSHGLNEWGETDFILSFNFENTEKTVRAWGYLTPIGSNLAAELPYPLDEIHQKLSDVVKNRTEEVYKETY